jgi:hypothetical protein
LSAINVASTLFASGGAMPRGFKHFATSPTHPHAGNNALSSGRAKRRPREKFAVVQKFSGCR